MAHPPTYTPATGTPLTEAMPPIGESTTPPLCPADLHRFNETVKRMTLLLQGFDEGGPMQQTEFLAYCRNDPERLYNLVSNVASNLTTRAEELESQAAQLEQELLDGQRKEGTLLNRQKELENRISQ